MDPTTTFLTCARCQLPTRPFHESVMEGKLEMPAETPFTARLAYKCTKCDRIFCALCCHPAALVKEMLQPGRFSLPEEFIGPHSQAACPECRARVRPCDTIDAEWEGPADDGSKPLTLDQRVFAGFFGLMVVGISALAMDGGVTVFGVLFGAFGLFMLGMAVFAK